MISPSRLKTLARENKVTAGLMEKDWVNSWILYSIYSSSLGETTAFKGGTALSKIYFPEIWRFSEDLDMTCFGDTGKGDFKEEMESTLSEVSRKSGIDFHIKSTHFRSGYGQFKIQYDASLKRKNTTRLDVTFDEELVFDLEEKSHLFEDIPEFTARVYSLREIFVEKIRSLFERKRARDFFDVYKILEVGDFGNDEKIASGLKKKMRSKDMDLKLEISEDRAGDIESYWDTALDRLISRAEKPAFFEAIERIELFLDCLKTIDEDFN